MPDTLDIEIDALKAESEGRLEALKEKAGEAEREWIRAENAEAVATSLAKELDDYKNKHEVACATITSLQHDLAEAERKRDVWRERANSAADRCTRAESALAALTPR